jgi:hypothetical protein
MPHLTGLELKFSLSHRPPLHHGGDSRPGWRPEARSASRAWTGKGGSVHYLRNPKASKDGNRGSASQQQVFGVKSGSGPQALVAEAPSNVRVQTSGPHIGPTNLGGPVPPNSVPLAFVSLTT